MGQQDIVTDEEIRQLMHAARGIPPNSLLARYCREALFEGNPEARTKVEKVILDAREARDRSKFQSAFDPG